MFFYYQTRIFGNQATRWYMAAEVVEGVHSNNLCWYRVSGRPYCRFHGMYNILMNTTLCYKPDRSFK